MIYTIGYQGLPVERFRQIIEEKNIDIVIDVRSKPSGRAYQYNRKALEKMFLDIAPKMYWYKGDILGGFAPIHESAIEWLTGCDHNMGIKWEGTDTGDIRFNYLILCYEANPCECHRHYELGKRLLKRGIDIIHLYQGREIKASELEVRK
jgi:uncharacterized protein (DUF488 family)